MGMGFNHAGSATYSRFRREMTEIAKLFGILENTEFTAAKQGMETTISDWMGKYEDLNMTKYVYPENTPKEVIAWFEDPYEYLTPDKTKIVHDYILEPYVWLSEQNNYRDEVVKDVSPQIAEELKCSVEFDTGWLISR